MNSLDTFESVIGLEVHAQLLTQSKMFCDCPNKYGSSPNSNICPVCTGQPGSLPVVNRHAIELGVRAALALNCQISEESIFARKNYFYPDLPKGYQISQYETPFSQRGYLRITLKNKESKTIGITRIHFEEDAGKSIHGADATLINLNRAGVPLVEIVSEPDMRDAFEAGQYLRTLRDILKYADICDGNMEEGNFRCDANISLRKIGEKKFGTKVELKNINSFKYVEKAIEFEIGRQAEILSHGEKISQQTRLWNSAQNITELMREKEEAHDYRYFPDPDLPHLVIPREWQAKIKSSMPELPDAKRTRFISDFFLSDYDAAVCTSSRELAIYFEEVQRLSGNPKLSANWVLNELLGKLNAGDKTIEQTPVSAINLAELIRKIGSSEISGKMAKDVFEIMFESGRSATEIIKEKGLSQISDIGELTQVIKKIISMNSQQAEDYRSGKVKLLGFFIGLVMKETKGQANPGMVNELVKQVLEGEKS